MASSARVILVDEKDNEIGTEEKLAAHEAGTLHRAFSVFVFSPDGKMMIQQRAQEKYHSGGLWTNTCCSHQAPGEETLAAAHRRLQEEMGFDCEMREIGTLLYKAPFDNGLTEHEFDHILLGMYDGVAKPDPSEVAAWKWIDPTELQNDMHDNPDAYTYWFKLALPGVLAKRA